LQRLFQQGVSGTDNFLIGKNASGTDALGIVIANTTLITYSWVPTIGVWYHIAVVRTGTGASGVTLYINGVAVATGSGSGTVSQNQVIVGGINWTTGYNVQGYLSNVRYNNTSLYTSNFTPSTTSLTAVTGTVLLTCQNNRFVDNSANNFAITVNGSPSIQAFSPFVPAYITPTTYSGFFGSSTGKLTIASMTALGSDFTLECWVCTPASFVDYNTIWDSRASDPDTTGFLYAFNASSKLIFFTNNSFQLTTTTSFAKNTWYHLALVRSGSGSGNVKIYINGVADATTATYTTSFTRTIAAIGNIYTATGYALSGCISNLRTVTTALYTANFTPPTAALPTY
jgi:hypothetical protein